VSVVFTFESKQRLRANSFARFSPVRFVPFLVLSLIGLLPRYLLYVYAGTHLGEVENPADLWSLPLVGALALLAVLPWLTQGVLGRLKRWRSGGSSRIR